MLNELLNVHESNVLIIGDSMLDCYIDVYSNKISNEYSGLIYKIKDKYYKLGGAAYVAANLAAYNIKVKILTVVGDDSEKDIFLKLINKLGIDDSYIITDKNYHTII